MEKVSTGISDAVAEATDPYFTHSFNAHGRVDGLQRICGESDWKLTGKRRAFLFLPNVIQA